ncbi:MULTISPECIES: hypothetical protein [Halolamina]|uniref:Uncharacterized protein n=1 Tax=Halolamina pelagica TaxID=699431 RepID=A0A1I5VR61_9EURY|nr:MULTISPECIES: hypothetical protein [Halolamina]NHX37811.1 hypothetical protein [Halolamina sp. R1-12]SFQ10044.1 hypothetical protein SAMN05216277_11941 [Halolamina pelagica]
MTRSADLAFVVVLVLAAVAPASMAAAQESVYEADTDHELATDGAIAEFRNQSHVTGGVYGLNMSLTVADDADDAGLNDWLTRSSGRVFLRIDYNEDLARTVRFYVPKAYVAPQLKQGLEASNADLPADLEPTQDRNHTAVTVTLDGPTEAVFPISATRGSIASGRSTIGDMVANVTGFSLPSLTPNGADWHYIAASELADNQTDSVPSNATTIQYDTNTGTDAEANWVPVPDCDGGTDGVCTYTKADHLDRTFLLSTSGDPPQVRYREGSSITGQLDTAVNDALHGVDNLVNDVTGLFGDDDDDGDA